MRKIVICFFIILSAVCLTAAVDSEGNTVPALVYGEDYYYKKVLVESPPMMVALASTLVYFNYESVADNNAAYAIFCSGAMGLGALLAVLTSGDQEGIVFIASTYIISLGAAGLIYYPFYGIANGYITNNHNQQIRGWIGFGATSIAMAMMMMEKRVMIDKTAVTLLPVIGENYSGLFLNVKI